MSFAAFPPVQTMRKAALGHGQVGPLMPETGSLKHMGKTEQKARKTLFSILVCPDFARHKQSLYPLATHLVASKGNSGAKKGVKRNERCCRQGGEPSIKIWSSAGR